MFLRLVISHFISCVVFSGLVTPSGLTSVPMGMETPDMIELRKKRIEDAMDQGGDTPAPLYQVIPEKKQTVGGAMMGSSHIYDINAVSTHIVLASRESGRLLDTQTLKKHPLGHPNIFVKNSLKCQSQCHSIEFFHLHILPMTFY